MIKVYIKSTGIVDDTKNTKDDITFHSVLNLKQVGWKSWDYGHIFLLHLNYDKDCYIVENCKFCKDCSNG